MRGVVIKSTGSSYFVMSDNGQKMECRLKGKFKIQGISSTNPVSVGDYVQYDMIVGDIIGVITDIEKRKNYIVRKSTNLSKRQHIIACNIDQAICIATLAFPRTSTGFIDRFLVTAEQYHIPAFIVFNKIDVYPPDLIESLDELIEIYNRIGYKCLITSAITNQGINEFNHLLKKRIILKQNF